MAAVRPYLLYYLMYLYDCGGLIDYVPTLSKTTSARLLHYSYNEKIQIHFIVYT